jgi:uncharacterized membrane protein YdbT with pleckstrin-like domain
MPESSNASAAEVILKQNPSWFQSPGNFFLAFLLIITGLALFLFPIAGYQEISGILSLLLLVFAAFILITAVLGHYSTDYALTKTGVVKTRGLLSKDVATIPYGKIQDIRLKKSFLERILGIGNIYIDTAGENGIEMILRGVPDPDRTHNMILGMMKK